jgi:hypothetical protein
VSAFFVITRNSQKSIIHEFAKQHAWEVNQEIDVKMKRVEDGRLVVGKSVEEMIYNLQEWKKLLRTAGNRHILHIPTEWMNERNSANVTTYKTALTVWRLKFLIVNKHCAA